MSAVLLTAGLFGLGVLDRDANAPASSRAPAAAPTVGGARPNGDVEQIYRSASAGVVSVRTGNGSGTGFVIDRDGTLVTNAHVVGDAETVQVQFSNDATATARVAGVDRSSDLAVLTSTRATTGVAARARARRLRGRAHRASWPSPSAPRSGCRRPRRRGSCRARAATSRRPTASRSTA